jgi:photosystem II stability/assembly factor-like uncharacterized protein
MAEKTRTRCLPNAGIISALGLGIALVATLLLPLGVSGTYAQTQPTIASVSPDTFVVGSQDVFTITGSGFEDTPTVTVDSQVLVDVGFVTTTTLTSTTPSGLTVGVYTVTVTNPGGLSDSLPGGLTIQNPAPTLLGLDPGSGIYGQSTMLTITGTAFIATPTVSLGGVPCAAQYVSSTTLTTTVPGGLPPGIHDLTVHNPGPGSPQGTMPHAFTLHSPVPTVTLCEPSSAANDLDTQVIITGAGFAPTPTVSLDTTLLDQVTWVSPTRLTALVPWGMDARAYTMTVTNPDPGASSATLSNAFTATQAIGVWNASELYGGSIGEILMDSGDPQTIYAASSDIGLFRSTDGGDNWSFLFAGLGVSDLAIEPNAPHTLYMFGPWSLYRSADGGDTLVPLTTPFSAGQPVARSCWSAIKPYPHPIITGTVYAASCGDDEGHSGLLKSTNWGDDWVSATMGLTDTQVTALAFHPTDPLTMYLGTASGNIFVSGDGGDSWTFAARPLGYVNQLAVNPFGSHEVWAAAHAGLGDPCAIAKSSGADLSSWVTVDPMPGHAWCDAAWLNFAPVGWGETYSGTVFVNTWWGGGYKTVNSGQTWTEFKPAHSFAERFSLHPSDPNIIYMADRWHGFHRTTDGGTSWQMANQGLTAVLPEQLSTVRNQPDVVYALGPGPGIFRATRGGQTWQFLPAEEAVASSSMLVDPFTPTRVYLGAFAEVYISEDGGQSWPTSGDIVPPPQYEDCRIWPRVLRADPGTPGALLAGIQHSCNTYLTVTGSIYTSTNYGQNWTRVELGEEIATISDIAYDPVDPTVVYAGTEGSGLLKSMDGGQVWTPIGEDIAALDAIISIAVDPRVPHRVFVSTATGAGEGIYVSDDGGQSWRQADSPLVGYNIEQILMTPGELPVLYAAAIGGPEGPGLYRSSDGAQSWQRASGAVGQVPVYSLATVTTTDRVILYAGTTGGYVTNDSTHMLQMENGESTLIDAGVYRYTTQRLTKHTYLPVVLRAFAEQHPYPTTRVENLSDQLAWGAHPVRRSGTLDSSTGTSPAPLALLFGGACGAPLALLSSSHLARRRRCFAVWQVKDVQVDRPRRPWDVHRLPGNLGALGSRYRDWATGTKRALCRRLRRALQKL